MCDSIYRKRFNWMTSGKLQNRSHNWSFRVGTAKEVAPQLKDKESEVLAIVADQEDPLIRIKFQALKNLIFLSMMWSTTVPNVSGKL